MNLKPDSNIQGVQLKGLTYLYTNVLGYYNIITL